jgi:hypothetical protein
LELRKELIRLAHKHPEFRKDLIPLLGAKKSISIVKKKATTSKVGSETWYVMLSDLKAHFLSEIVKEAASLIEHEGDADILVGSTVIKGTLNGKKLEVLYQWGQWDSSGKETVVSYMHWDGKRREEEHNLINMSPMNVATESLFQKFKGLLP